MKFLHIVWKNLLRRKIRTTFTLLSIFVAFVLFGYLMAVRSAFNMGVDLAGADRLMVLNKISIIMPVPRSYIDKVRAIEGVKDVKNELQVVAPAARAAVTADDKQIYKSVEQRFKQDPQLKNAKIDAKVDEADIGKIAATEIDPISDLYASAAYRKHVIGAMVKKAAA